MPLGQTGNMLRDKGGILVINLSESIHIRRNISVQSIDDRTVFSCMVVLGNKFICIADTSNILSCF